LQDFSGLISIHKTLKNPANPLYFLRRFHVALGRLEKNENQPRSNEEHEDFLLFYLRFLRFFVVIFRGAFMSRCDAMKR
jgi:hypothetical protein